MHIVSSTSARGAAHAAANPAHGNLLLDLDGNVCHCCPDLIALMGLTLAEVLGQPVRKFLPDVPIQAGTSGYNAAWASFCAGRARGQTSRLALPGAGGGHIEVLLESALIRVRKERVIMLMIRPAAAKTDDAITYWFVRRALANSGAVMITNANGSIEHVNSTFERLTGMNRSHFVGHTPILVLPQHEDTRPDGSERVSRLL